MLVNISNSGKLILPTYFRQIPLFVLALLAAYYSSFPIRKRLTDTWANKAFFILFLIGILPVWGLFNVFKGLEFLDENGTVVAYILLVLFMSIGLNLFSLVGYFILSGIYRIFGGKYLK